MSKSFFKILAMGIALYASFVSYAQNLTIPQKEFSISAEDSMNIKPGSIQKLNIWVLRSKSWSKTNVSMTVSSTLPEGVLVSFQPPKGNFDYCEATISVNPESKPGTYLIVVSGTISYKTKGQIIKLTIPEPVVTSDTAGKQ